MSRRHTGRSRRFQVRVGTLFDPLADPDLVGLWLASDATDDGTALTVPNSLEGGTDATATGASRPVIDPTGVHGQPGIDVSAVTEIGHALTAAVSISGESQLTMYAVALVQDTTLAYMLQYGTGTQNARVLYNNPGRSNFQIYKLGSGVSQSLNIDAQYGCLHHPRVCAFRWDIGASVAADELSVPVIDGISQFQTAATNTGNSTGSFGAGPLYFGIQNTGGSVLKGQFFAVAMVARRHTDAEVAKWTRYLRALAGTTDAVEVMWVGDSLTAGTIADTAQWRERIQDRFDAAGDYRYRAVGELPPSNPTFTHDRSLSASGDEFTDNTAYLTSYRVGTTYRPDVVPIMLGTNDIDFGGLTNAQLAVRYGDYLDDLSALLPNALLIAQKLSPRTGTHSAQVTDWNANYHETMVLAAQGRGVNVISDDTIATLPGITYLPDGLHYAAASTDLIGDAMYDRVLEWAGWAA